jgi:hypothetical protein
MKNGTFWIKELRIKKILKEKFPNFFDPYTRLFATIILYDFNNSITMVWPKNKQVYDEYITFLGKNNTRILKNLTFSLQEVEKLNSSVYLLIFLADIKNTELSEYSVELAIKARINSFENRDISTNPILATKQLIRIVEHFQKDNLGSFVNILIQPLKLKKKVDRYTIKNKTIEIDFTIKHLFKC